MEREKQINRKRKRTQVIWTSLAVGTLALTSCGDKEASQEYSNENVNSQPLNTRVVPTPEHLRNPDFRIQSVQPIIERIKDPKDQVLEVVREHPEVFSQNDIEDIGMYFPIYEKVGQRYDLPWYLLFIVHKAESTASRNEGAFESGKHHYGAMQRDVSLHTKENVAFASRGLEDLANLPQRNVDDWQEIAWGALKIREDMDEAEANGSQNLVLSALLSYSASGPANFRFSLFIQYQQIFEPLP